MELVHRRRNAGLWWWVKIKRAALADLWDRVKKEIQTQMIKSLILHREESGRHVGALVKKITLSHQYWYEGVDAALLAGCLSSVQKVLVWIPSTAQNQEWVCISTIQALGR